jgi:hypothetical protein
MGANWSKIMRGPGLWKLHARAAETEEVVDDKWCAISFYVYAWEDGLLLSQVGEDGSKEAAWH